MSHPCILDRLWPAYIVTSLVTLFGGVIVLLVLRMCSRRKFFSTNRVAVECRLLLSRPKSAAHNLLLGNSILCKVVVTTFWILDTAALVVYLVEGTKSNPYERDLCEEAIKSNTQIVWIVLMFCSLVHFIIRFIAAEDKVLMWIDRDSLVDHFTIVPTIVGLYLNRNWTGLRFLRSLHLIRLKDVLLLTKIVHNQLWLHFISAMTMLLIAFIVSAGMFFQLENSGDPWHNYENQNKQMLYFWDCYYLVLIILTTIGFGDMSPTTDLGRIFLAVSVLLTLATFSQLLPELSQMLGSRSKFKKPYQPTSRKTHFVITGNITYETLTTVVRNFICQDNSKRDIVIVDRARPSDKVLGFFRRNYSHVLFIEGTVLHIPTLRRAKVETATAVLILANRLAENPSTEDAANIMRTVAVKNYRPDVRIIIQILQYQSKEQLLHIPSWSWRGVNCDEIVCISELKMGLLAKNCMAPGSVTILSNLMQGHSFMSSKQKKKKQDDWMSEYVQGTEHRLYVAILSDSFINMTFVDVAEYCFRQYGIILLAVDHQTGSAGGDQTEVRINPSRPSYRIQRCQRAYFIASSEKQIQQLAQYGHQEQQITRGLTTLDIQLTISSSDVTGDDHAEAQDDFNYYFPTHSSVCSSSVVVSGMASSRESVFSSNNNDSGGHNNINRVLEIYDPSGTVYWCPSTPIEQALLDPDLVREYNLSDHVIFVLSISSGSSTSPGVGLRNFMTPLRLSSIAAAELKPVVFYANLAFIESEWHSIACFPQIYVYPSSGSLHADLKALNVQRCAMCLVMDTTGLVEVDDVHVDLNAIRTTMQITSLCGLGNTVMSRQLQGETTPDDLYRQMSLNADVQLFVQLEYDSSVAYIEDDDDDDPSIPVCLTLPYACGRVLLSSVLDCLVTTALLNTGLMRLCRALITGVEVPDFESVLAEGLGIVRRRAILDSTNGRRRSNLALVELTQPPLSDVQHENQYGKLVTGCLRSEGILCIGLYRLLPDKPTNTSQSSLPYVTSSIRVRRRQKRYVITCPPFDFELIHTDKVYIFKPYELTVGHH